MRQESFLVLFFLPYKNRGDKWIKIKKILHSQFDIEIGQIDNKNHWKNFMIKLMKSKRNYMNCWTKFSMFPVQCYMMYVWKLHIAIFYRKRFFFTKNKYSHCLMNGLAICANWEVNGQYRVTTLLSFVWWLLFLFFTTNDVRALVKDKWNPSVCFKSFLLVSKGLCPCPSVRSVIVIIFVRVHSAVRPSVSVRLFAPLTYSFRPCPCPCPCPSVPIINILICPFIYL